MNRAWQRMLSGRRLDLLDPSPLDIEIEDIAHGLARVARWNGQTLGDCIFSVAQHSLLVENLVASDASVNASGRLFALLHDAPEYVIGDMISPFKAAIGDPYKQIESTLLQAILLRFSLPSPPAPVLQKKVKKADRSAAFFEATVLAGFSQEEAYKFFGRPALRPSALDDLLAPIAPDEAQRRFLEKYSELERMI